MTEHAQNIFSSRLKNHLTGLLSERSVAFPELLLNSLNCDPSVLRNTLSILVAEGKVIETEDGFHLKSNSQRAGGYEEYLKENRGKKTAKAPFWRHEFSRLDRAALQELVRRIHNDLPAESPVYSQWWFAPEVYLDLIHFLYDTNAGNDQDFAFLGASTVGAVFSWFTEKRVDILDVDNVLLKSLKAHCGRNVELREYDAALIPDNGLRNQFSTVFCDPPWGSSALRVFLIRGCQLLKPGGKLIISLPPLFTRPAIEEERQELIGLAKKWGLTLSSSHARLTKYSVPVFERNAYREVHIELEKQWRSGDVFVFDRFDNREGHEEYLLERDCWEQFSHGSARIFLKRDGRDEKGEPKVRAIGSNGSFTHCSTSTRSPQWLKASIVSTLNCVGDAFGRSELHEILRLAESDGERFAYVVKKKEPSHAAIRDALAAMVSQKRVSDREEGGPCNVKRNVLPQHTGTT